MTATALGYAPDGRCFNCGAGLGRHNDLFCSLTCREAWWEDQRWEDLLG